LVERRKWVTHSKWGGEKAVGEEAPRKRKCVGKGGLTKNGGSAREVTGGFAGQKIMVGRRKQAERGWGGGLGQSYVVVTRGGGGGNAWGVADKLEMERKISGGGGGRSVRLRHHKSDKTSK